MTDVTLSSAVRSNLLSLQTTADMMSKTQERLATGLKVNSALDNPTNFFTASALNSRASDLSRLMDGVSNATQTLEAADNGISALTKLVESAQATARQALQTPATIDVPAPATPGTLNGAAFSTIDVSTGSASLSSATATGSAYAPLDITGGGWLAGRAVLTTGLAFSSPNDVDLSGGNNLSFDLEVNNSGSPTRVTIDSAAIAQLGGVSDAADVSRSEFVDLLNQEFTDAGLGVTARTSGVANIAFESTTIGSGAALEFSSMTSVGNVDVTSGLSAIATASAVGLDARPLAFFAFDIDVNNTGSQTIAIDQAAISQYNAGPTSIANPTSVTGAELAALINQELGDAGVPATASFASGALSITSNASGAASEIDIQSINDNTSGGVAGLSTGVQNGTDVRAADALSFSVAVDSGSDQAVRVDAAAVAAFNGAQGTSFLASALTADTIAAIINDQTTGLTASVDSGTGQLILESDTLGNGSDVTVSGFSQLVTGGSSGLSDGTNTGANSSTTAVTNPARAEFVTQYNELMGQIDELAEDSAFNGVNLLNGDDLSVIFNEDGSSTLSISGTSFDAAGLGLGDLASTGLDNDTAINTTLASLDTAITSLRSQASEFGSNLSIVETRENFTKSMVNTLETGSANLTLADTNEEGANLLALQTRQQLSSTALSLASQADQNVLRLF